MRRGLFALVKKDFRLMLSGRFFLLALGSLLLYSVYINFVYIKIDQEIFPVYLYGADDSQGVSSSSVAKLDSMKELQKECADGYAVGIDASRGTPELYMVSSGSDSFDNYRAAYAISALSFGKTGDAQVIGENNKTMKNRREITAEFLFFELAAVGFLGLAAMLFKEKQMGVIRVQGILPMSKNAFILSKVGLVLLSDLIFTVLLTVINVGLTAGITILPAVLIQAAILSLIMVLVGFFCAIVLPDFKQFSLLYLVLAIFVTTPVFLAVQTGIGGSWLKYHPMYHLFMAMRNAYFNVCITSSAYYISCVAAIVLLFLLVRLGLVREMKKEG